MGIEFSLFAIAKATECVGVKMGEIFTAIVVLVQFIFNVVVLCSQEKYLANNMEST